MRLGFMFTGVFWGVVLICIGVLAILKSVFNINVPIFRSAVALLIIYIGLSILVNGFYFERQKQSIMFDSYNIEVSDSHAKSDIIFGSGTIDFSDFALTEEHPKQEVNIVFSSGRIELPAGLPAKVVVSSAFGSANLPDGNSISFGEYTYKTSSYKEGENFLYIKANVVFSSLKVVER